MYWVLRTVSCAQCMLLLCVSSHLTPSSVLSGRLTVITLWLLNYTWLKAGTYVIFPYVLVLTVRSVFIVWPVYLCVFFSLFLHTRCVFRCVCVGSPSPIAPLLFSWYLNASEYDAAEACVMRCMAVLDAARVPRTNAQVRCMMVFCHNKVFVLHALVFEWHICKPDQ